MDDLRQMRNILITIVTVSSLLFTAACSVQWAIKNKNTDCGFTNDRIAPSGKKDPQIFYGPSGSER